MMPRQYMQPLKQKPEKNLIVVMTTMLGTIITIVGIIVMGAMGEDIHILQAGCIIAGVGTMIMGIGFALNALRAYF